MEIIYYMPFKPPDHSNPSGDLIIGTELRNFLEGNGHHLNLASRLRTRWIYLKPWLWPRVYTEKAAAVRRARQRRARLWLTYHTYYKSPDILGPGCSRRLGIPYVIFQGIYSTKTRRRMKTAPGYLLNRRALKSADFVFANKRRDYENLLRIVPAHRLKYVGPGIVPGDFQHDPQARIALRNEWRVGDVPVVLAAAMFRPGVKTKGLEQVIAACAILREKGLRFRLVLAGDGPGRPGIEALAQRMLPGQVWFAGKIPRNRLFRFYSAADIFAFPGIEESLGMVYLEAQSCGLPVAASNGWGAREAVVHGETGLLSGPGDTMAFAGNIARMIQDAELREKMGRAAKSHITRHHDLEKNYGIVETVLRRIAFTSRSRK